MPNLDPSVPPRVPAVQYLRMSREHQRYSPANQSAVIAEYAEKRGFDVVRTYRDDGRSGVSLKGRKALKQLLTDALSDECDFKVILVLDVSRWGRFQDPDQSAHYEFMCKQAGARVHYCGEAFSSDDGMSSMIMKSVKRVMAGEYSRELSAKVHRAQKQQARLGFKQGGTISYGIRRQLVTEQGEQRFILHRGQRKGLQTDRIRFAWGPDEEIATIRRIFDLFVKRGLSMMAIARRLNDEGTPAEGGNPWTNNRVRNVLTSEFMIGNYVYNKSSRKLQQPVSTNHPCEWIRVKVLPPVVPLSMFSRAAKMLETKPVYRMDDTEIIKSLKRLYREKGFLNVKLIDACEYTPSTKTYQTRFGSLANAYKIVGFEGPRYAWKLREDMPHTNAEMLRALKRLHRKHGYITSKLINQDRDVPSVPAYRLRFGLLRNAYALAGLPTSLAVIRAAVKKASSRNRPGAPN